MAAWITLINIIAFGIFILVSGVIIVKELKHRFELNRQEKKKRKKNEKI